MRLVSADPYVHPEIRFNYLEHEADREGFRRCVRLTREIVGQPAMDRYRGEELAPVAVVSADVRMPLGAPVVRAEARPGELLRSCLDASKLEARGWQRAGGLEEGLGATYAWIAGEGR